MPQLIDTTLLGGLLLFSAYFLWAPLQGFLVFLPVLLHRRQDLLRKAFALVGDPPASNAPRAYLRGLALADFWSVTGVLALTLPILSAAALEVTWTLGLVPLWLSPAVAGMFWMRLRRRRVRHAHAVGWAVAAAPSFAWVAYLVPRMGEFHWQLRGYDGLEMVRYTAASLPIGELALTVVAATGGALLVVAVVLALLDVRRVVVEATLVCTVPAWALMLLSMPLGFVYAAWCMAAVGFWVARSRVAGCDARYVLPLERTSTSVRLLDGLIHRRHDRWRALGIFGGLLAMTTALLASASLLPPEGPLRAVGEWLALVTVGSAGYFLLRRSMAGKEAAGVAVLAQLSAVAAFVALSDVGHLLTIEGLASIDQDIFRPGRYLVDAYASVPVEPQLIACVSLVLSASLVLSGGTGTYGAMVVGASWPIVGALAFKANELGLHEQEWPFRWEASQVWGATIGATVVLVTMWWVFGRELRELSDVATNDALNDCTEPR